MWILKLFLLLVIEDICISICKYSCLFLCYSLIQIFKKVQSSSWFISWLYFWCTSSLCTIDTKVHNTKYKGFTILALKTSSNPDRWLYWGGAVFRWMTSKSMEEPGNTQAPQNICLLNWWICMNIGTGLKQIKAINDKTVNKQVSPPN